MWPFKKKNERRPPEAEPVPPVDLNQPVVNPDLVNAIAAFANQRGPETLLQLQMQLGRAVYLVPMLTDAAVPSPAGPAGQITFQQGSQLKLLTCQDPDGRSVLPLFTDWQQIQAWTDEPVSTLVLPASDAWTFIIREGSFAGAVINPAGMALPLNSSLIQDLAVRGSA